MISFYVIGLRKFLGDNMFGQMNEKNVVPEHREAFSLECPDNAIFALVIRVIDEVIRVGNIEIWRRLDCVIAVK